MLATFVLVLASFVVTLASFVVTLAAFMVTLASFVLMVASFVLMIAAFMLLFAFSFLSSHFLCHVDSVGALFIIEVIPVCESIDHHIDVSHHFRAHWRPLVRVVAFNVVLMIAASSLFFLFVAA